MPEHEKYKQLLCIILTVVLIFRVCFSMELIHHACMYIACCILYMIVTFSAQKMQECPIHKWPDSLL